jgi:GTP-binding protein
MVETYLKERSNLRLVVLILDIRRDPSVQDLDLLGWLDHYRIPFLPVLTKTDKLSKVQVQRRTRQVEEMLTKALHLKRHPILFSAKTGEGKDVLWSIIEAL